MALLHASIQRQLWTTPVLSPALTKCQSNVKKKKKKRRKKQHADTVLVSLSPSRLRVRFLIINSMKSLHCCDFINKHTFQPTHGVHGVHAEQYNLSRPLALKSCIVFLGTINMTSGTNLSSTSTYLYMTSWASAVAGVSFNLSLTSSTPTKRPRPLEDATPFGLVISDTHRILHTSAFSSVRSRLF